MNTDFPSLDQRIRLALAEDVGAGDATTLALVPAEARATACMVARQDLVVCGLDVAAQVFRQLDPACVCTALVAEGARVSGGTELLRVQGAARALLSAERLALNLVQRLCGVAALTARYVAAVAPHRVVILDTRKTTPLWRDLEKAAVVCGGGANHRFGLFDRVMIKDNHVACWAAQQTGDLAAAVARARAVYPDLLVEVEVDRLDQLDAVLPEQPDWVLLDNMTPQQVREGVARCRGVARVEVSGGITLETVAAFAAAEPDAISVGALTHSAVAADVGLDWESAS